MNSCRSLLLLESWSLREEWALSAAVILFGCCGGCLHCSAERRAEMFLIAWCTLHACQLKAVQWCMGGSLLHMSFIGVNVQQSECVLPRKALHIGYCLYSCSGSEELRESWVWTHLVGLWSQRLITFKLTSVLASLTARKLGLGNLIWLCLSAEAGMCRLYLSMNFFKWVIPKSCENTNIR